MSAKKSGVNMKNVIIGLFALCVSGSAMAEVSFTQTAADSSACKTGVQKMELRRYLNGKSDAVAPKCYKAGGMKSTTPTINNCKTAFQKQQLRSYLNGKSGAMNPPSCYKAATWVGHAKSSASCNNFEKQQLRAYLNGKSGAVAPKCYK